MYSKYFLLVGMCGQNILETAGLVETQQSSRGKQLMACTLWHSGVQRFHQVGHSFWAGCPSCGQEHFSFQVQWGVVCLVNMVSNQGEEISMSRLKMQNKTLTWNICLQFIMFHQHGSSRPYFRCKHVCPSATKVSMPYLYLPLVSCKQAAELKVACQWDSYSCLQM